MSTVLRIDFDVSDSRTYNNLRRLWENALPKAPNSIMSIHVQPTLSDPDNSGRMAAWPLEPEFIEYLKSNGLSFNQETI
jgi:hypothetical protein